MRRAIGTGEANRWLTAVFRVPSASFTRPNPPS
jgi:hypothetical protein